jgi:hypothetical protein
MGSLPRDCVQRINNIIKVTVLDNLPHLCVNRGLLLFSVINHFAIADCRIPYDNSIFDSEQY